MLLQLKLLLQTVKFWGYLAIIIASGYNAYKLYQKYYGRIFSAGAQSVQIKWDAQKLLDQQAIIKAEALVKQSQQSLQQKADQLRSQKDAQIRSITHQRDAMFASLQSRPIRPTTNAQSSGQPFTTATVANTSTGCTGEGLFKSDAEFLTRYAADADTIKVSYQQCITQYQSAQMLP